MELLASFFLSHGRLARAQWFTRLLALGAACAAVALLAQQIVGEGGAALAAAPFVWGGVALSIRRLHDSGRGGRAMLWLLIPVAGPLWVLLLLCRRGAEGANRYGPDPSAGLDYLQVDIAK